MGARPEPVPQVVQTPASSVSALLGEVHDILQAIKSIPWERQLQEAQGRQVAAGAFDIFHYLFETCLCGMPCHSSEMMELGGSEMDVKLQITSCKCVCSLLILLGELYLRLGRAYTEDGQFSRALRAVDLAFLMRNSLLVPQFSIFFFEQFWKQKDRRDPKAAEFAWQMRNSLLVPHLPIFFREELRKLKDRRDPKAAEFAWQMRRLTPPPKEAFFPKGTFFERQALILTGDAYFEAQRTFDDSDVVIPHQEGEELEMSQEVEQELHRVVRSCKCFSISRFMLMLICLPSIVENKWEMNLSAAGFFYLRALQLSEDTENADPQHEGSEFTKIAHRKIGFVWHECGRRLAELGWHAKDKSDNYFIEAIDAFCRGKDVPNFALALCSRIEYHRKLAEFRETHQGPEGRIKSIEEVRVKYQEALDLCSEAKNRLKEWGDELHCKEVDTEEAHTYLKQGMFLMKVDPNRNRQIPAKKAIHEAMNLYNKLDREHWEVTNSQYQLDCIRRERLFFESVKSDVTVDTEEADMYLELGIMLMREDKLHYDKQEEPNRKGRISAEEAIHEAIDLYRKLDCQQGVAYSKYRLGCVRRDRMLFEFFRSKVRRLQGDKSLLNSWLEAEIYYIGVGDIDMYLRIRMEHSDLYSSIKPKGLDQALIQLLEAIPCKMVVFGHGSSSVSKEFIRKLLELLKNMCAVAKSQRNNASRGTPSRANNYEFMARMYGRALQLGREGGKDYHSLYDMWKNYATVKS